MARPKKYHISPTDDELKTMKLVIRKRKTSRTVRCRCQIVIDGLISLHRNVNSDQARRKLDGRAEARLIEIACSPAPEGHSWWTLRLLEEQGEMLLDTPVGKNAIGRALKRQTSTSQKYLLVHPQKKEMPENRFLCDRGMTKKQILNISVMAHTVYLPL